MQPAPPLSPKTGSGEPRPALGRPPLGPGLPRLTLPPPPARAGSAMSLETRTSRVLRQWAKRTRLRPRPEHRCFLTNSLQSSSSRFAQRSTSRDPAHLGSQPISMRFWGGCPALRRGETADWSASGNRWGCPPSQGFWFFKLHRRAGGKGRGAFN